MTKKLFFQAIIKFMFGLILFALLLFVPAGTIMFWNGWLLIVVLFVPMFVAGIVIYKEYKTKVRYKVIPFVW